MKNLLKPLYLSVLLLLIINLNSNLTYAQEKHAFIKSVNVPSKIYYTDTYWLSVTVHNYDAGVSGANLHFDAYLDGNYWFTSSTQYVWRGNDYTWSLYYNNLNVGTHKVHMVLYWLDGSNRRWQDTSSDYGTLVVRLYLSNWSPQPLSIEKGKNIPSALAISFTNGGNDIMYDTTVLIKDSKGLAFSPFSQNVGNTMPEGKTTLSFFVTAPRTLDTGTYNVLFDVSYKDFMGRTYTETKTATINVVSLSTMLSLSNPRSPKIGESIAISARLTDSNNNPVMGQSVNIRINDSTIGTAITDSLGNAVITYKITLPASTYTISARYDGSSTYATSYATSTIMVYPLMLTIISTVNNAEIVAVNGTLYSTDISGKTIISINQLGAYAIRIITPYPLKTDTRAIFVQWGDGVANNTRIVTMDSDQTFSIITKIQHLLKVNAPSEASTIGQGWYDANSKVPVKIDYTWNVTKDERRNNLISYTIDSGSNVTVPRSGNGTFNAIVLMQDPHVITFHGVTQYYLAISGGENITFGTPSQTKDRWYDAGASTTISTSYIWSVVPFKSRERLLEWSLDDSPISRVPIEEKRVFTTPPVLMTVNHFLRFDSITQYYLNVTSPHGNVTGPDWYDEGAIANFSVSPTKVPAGFLSHYVFTEWSGDYVGKEDSASIIMDSPKVIAAEWVTDYTQLYLAFASLFLAVVIVTAVFLVKRKQISKKGKV